MAPDERSDEDEMNLINAEFESMVSGLNLDQSTPRTYLDDLDNLDDVEASEQSEIYTPPHIKRGFHGTIQSIIQSILGWWRNDKNDESDGAQV
jgi:hypothetical protein